MGANPVLRSAAACAIAAACVLGGSAIAAPAGAASELPTAAGAAPRSTHTVRLKPSGRVDVHWRGNGHGHGMSQYGAEGAALAGLSTRHILRFYYPHTRLKTVRGSRIRVWLSDAGRYPTVFSGRGLRVRGFGRLPASHYSRFRLTPKGAGLRLQGRRSGKWRTIAGNLPPRAAFHSPKGFVRIAQPGGYSTRYRGRVGAVRAGSGEIIVNRVRLDAYTAGVVPREMPASWQPAAVHAQAIAARTYARSEMAAHAADAYDICDTTNCQVYGGMARFDRAGHLLYTDDVAAVSSNRRKVLTYHGTPIFAQFSASNGGATVDGGEPYLVGKPDPHDDASSGDPYLHQSRLVKVSRLARYYRLKRVTRVRVTKRDGNGPWGGRVLHAYVVGTKGGHKVRRSTSGDELGAALGVWTDYLRLTRP